MQDPWTDRLSDYLDDELDAGDRRAVEAHLAGCGECTRTLDALRQVVARARALPPRPPRHDLWPEIDARLRTTARGAAPRALSARFTVAAWQLAAAAVLVAAISGVAAWQMHSRWTGAGAPGDGTGTRADLQGATGPAVHLAPDVDVPVRPVDLADAQYDAAVADLQRALDRGRGRLDAATIAVVERNLQTIDQAIAQARQALAQDPANSYLSGHLVETRRRKLELLRRAAALASDMN